MSTFRNAALLALSLFTLMLSIAVYSSHVRVVYTRGPANVLILQRVVIK